MTNLIPEQRLDRNGKLVTKHVRATPKQTAGRSALPQPKLAAKVQSKTGTKTFKPRSSQLQQTYHSHPASRYALDERLMTTEERQRGGLHGSYYAYTASEVDAYEVLSVAPIGAALMMLTRGIRTADEAREYLTQHGAADLIVDHRDMIQEALEKNVNHYDFVEHYELSFTDEGRSSDNLIDAIRFSSTSLNQGVNSTAVHDILSGDISYEDIKAVGVTNLKPHHRLSSLQVTFRRIKRGEGDYTIDGIKEIIKRSSEEKMESRAFNYLCRAMDELGMEEVLKVKTPTKLASNFHSYKIAPGSSRYGDDAVQRALYATQFEEGLGYPIMGVYSSDEFYNAGIPVDVAVDVRAKGGGVREAQAIHNEGIESGLSGGWL